MVQSIDPIMQYFKFDHLPDRLQKVSEKFHALAWDIHDTLPRSPERTVALRKILEGKDAAVRAANSDGDYTDGQVPVPG